MNILESTDLGSLPPKFGFGASGLGNLGRLVTEEEAFQTLDAAWRAGFRYFDTSPLYGYGLSELRLGRFLREKRRDEFVLSSKVGRYFVPPFGRDFSRGSWRPPLDMMPVLDYSSEATLRSLEQSAARLGISSFDIVYIHDIDRRTHGKDFERRFGEAVDGAYRVLSDLRSAGHIRGVGVGINDADVATRFMREIDLDVVMLAGRYTLLDLSALSECLPTADQRGVGVVAVGVFNSGILAKGTQSGATFDYEAAPENVLTKARAIEAVCSKHQVPLAAAAVQFPLAHPAVVSIVLGMSRPDSVARSVDFLSTQFPPSFWTDLKARELLPADVPTPT